MMKSCGIYILILAVSCITNNLLSQEAGAKLNAAVYEEEVNGDLDLAIQKYEQILKVYPDERPVVAEVLYRLGLASEKRGNAKASEYYLRLLNDYKDQAEFVSLASKRLKKLGTISNGQALENSSKSTNSQLLRTSKVQYRGGPVRNISPDGKYLTYSAPLGNLAIYDRINDKTTVLTPDPQKKDAGRDITSKPKGIATKTIWSPDSKKIAYLWVREDEGEDLRIYDLITGEIRILCPFVGKEVPVPYEWTVDGKYILCTTWYRQDDIIEISLLDVEYCNHRILKKLPPNPHRKFLSSASISPDGQYILYSDNNEHGKTDLYLMSQDNTINRKVFDKSGSDEYDPLWLSDGKSFLFFSNHSKSNALWKATFDNNLNINSSDILIDGLGFIHKHVGLTNAGLYYYWSHIRILDLYTASIDIDANTIGQQDLVVRDDNIQRLSPSWSADGTKIACIKIPNSETVLEIINMESGKKNELNLNLPKQSSITYQKPVWAFEDKKLLFCVRNRGIKNTSSIFSGTVFEILMVDVETLDVQHLVLDGHVPVMGGDSILIFKRDHSLIKKDIYSGEEQIFFTSEEDHLGFRYNVTQDGKHLAYLLGPNDQFSYNNQLLVYSFEQDSFKTIWHVGPEMNLHAPLWLNDGIHILVDCSNTVLKKQEFYIINSITGEKRKVELTKGVPDQNMLSIDIDPTKKKLIYVIRKTNVNLWSLENF